MGRAGEKGEGREKDRDRERTKGVEGGANKRRKKGNGQS